MLKHDLSEETNISRFGEYEYAREDSAVVLQEDDYNELIESENYQELNSVMASMEYEENQKEFINFIRGKHTRFDIFAREIVPAVLI